MQNLRKQGWLRFRNKIFNCPEVNTEQIKLYMSKKRLPSPCDDCYKALIFWSDEYSETNVENFFQMIHSMKKPYSGKFNEFVVVFYFRRKEKMNAFIDYLKEEMSTYNVKGTIQWRRACKKYQDMQPDLWENAKTIKLG